MIDLLVEMGKSGLFEPIIIEAQVEVFRGDRKKLSELLGFSSIDGNSLIRSHELIQFPYFSRDGKIEFSRFKLLPPFNGTKYLQPKGIPIVPYILPRIWEISQKPNYPLWIIEGEKKALKLIQHKESTIALPGVWQFRNGEVDPDQQDLCKDLNEFVWKGRTVFFCFDSDLWINPQVRLAMWELALRLHGRGALVRFVTWPMDQGKGIDDFLVFHEREGVTAEEKIRELREAAKSLTDFICPDHQDAILRALALVDLSEFERGKLIRLLSKKLGATITDIRKELDRIHARTQTAAFKKAGGDFSLSYRIGTSGIFWLKPIKEGHIPVQLANFSAEIVGDIIEDDGLETHRIFQIHALFQGRESIFSVPAKRFSVMDWPTEHLGAQALIFPGQAMKDHCRAAIQLLSNDIAVRQVFTHIGWRNIDGVWLYLHAGGAIGSEGSVPGVEVSLREELSRFLLPDPPDGTELVMAIQASLRLLEVGPPSVTYPVFCTIWRPVLPEIPIDLSVHLEGSTGQGKSELAALAQQHYGPEMTARHLPCSWSSTGNALESLSFLVKDALLCVDDFAPCGSVYDISNMHRQADRILRAQGNRSGRQRMRSDGSLALTRYPRGLILSTGEDIPRGASLRARFIVLSVERATLNWNAISQCQDDALAGVYAQALSGFIRWVAARYEKIREEIHQQFVDLRARFAGEHKRIPANAAQLALGLRFFLNFAEDVGALSQGEADQLWLRGIQALDSVADRQEEYQAASDPVLRFVELLAGAIAAGRAHVANEDGEAPVHPQAWGWRAVTIGSGENEREEWRPQGDRIGWTDNDNLFLEPEASYRLAQVMGRDSGEALVLTSRVLHKRLWERKMISSVVEGNERRFVGQKTLEGRKRRVLFASKNFLKAVEGYVLFSGETGETGEQELETKE